MTGRGILTRTVAGLLLLAALGLVTSAALLAYEWASWPR